MRWRRVIIASSVLFVLAAVLGVAIWSTVARGSSPNGPLLQVEATKGVVERMIEQGKLSRHPARYWRKLPQ